MDVEKQCKSCDIFFPANNTFFGSQLKGKYGLRSKCKNCLKIERKVRESSNEFKEKKRLKMAEWRINNPEKVLEINRKCYLKNKENINNKKRDRYKNDPEYKAKSLEYEKKYRESGKRQIINSKPQSREKAIIRSKKRRTIAEKLEHDYLRAKEWRKQNKNYLDQLHKKRILELSDSYVACSMRKKVAEVPFEVLETKRIIIKLKRELKNK
jgi:hypothetical protein